MAHRLRIPTYQLREILLLHTRTYRSIHSRILHTDHTALFCVGKHTSSLQGGIAVRFHTAADQTVPRHMSAVFVQTRIQECSLCSKYNRLLKYNKIWVTSAIS
jgi:hypothetical protein